VIENPTPGIIEKPPYVKKEVDLPPMIFE